MQRTATTDSRTRCSRLYCFHRTDSYVESNVRVCVVLKWSEKLNSWKSREHVSYCPIDGNASSSVYPSLSVIFLPLLSLLLFRRQMVNTQQKSQRTYSPVADDR